MNVDDLKRLAQPSTCLAVRDYVSHFTNVVRLQILCRLIHGEESVQDLASTIDQRQSTVSQQLKPLRMAGIVNRQRVGNRRVYKIADERAVEMMRFIADLATRFDAKRDAQSTENPGKDEERAHG